MNYEEVNATKVEAENKNVDGDFDIYDFSNADKEALLSDDFMAALFMIKNEVVRQKMKNMAAAQAKKLKCKSEFDSTLKAWERQERKMRKEDEAQRKAEAKELAHRDLNNMTHFNSRKYPDLKCGNWIADETGVVTFGERGQLQACYHPILPIKRYENLETGCEKIKIAFKKGAKWKEITCDKDTIASASKIVSLSNAGVAVTSENARYLVKYLADVENFNIFEIPERVSTSKLGWVKDNDKLEFIPFYKEIEFDGDSKFKNIFEDIKESGNREEWYSFMRETRRGGRIEPRIMMAASFASVLIKMCNALPFFVHLYGQSEGGKTLCIMCAASIWGNPSMESSFTGDFLSTQTAIEVRADMLNHLPYIMDDTAQVIEKYKGDFSGLIYTLCSGNGKDRSNRNLGLNRASNWHCAFLTTGETPITKEYGQAGAANRVLEIETGFSRIFTDGVGAARILTENYGHAGKDFVEAIKNIGVDGVIEMQRKILKAVEALGKMKKQSISMSILLTADKIATDYLFKDGAYIELNDIAECLKSESDISENERCYEYIIGEISKNRQKFTHEKEKDNKTKDSFFYSECWGIISTERVWINKNEFDRMCRECSYNSAAFLSWAKANNLLVAESGRTTIKKMINGARIRTVCLKLKDESGTPYITIDEDFFAIDE